MSSRALDPTAARPSTAPKLPLSATFVNGPSIYLAAQAKGLGIRLGSPPSSPHSQAISDFPSPKWKYVAASDLKYPHPWSNPLQGRMLPNV